MLAFFLRIGSAWTFLFFSFLKIDEIKLILFNIFFFFFLGLEGHRLSQERCFDTTVMFLFQKYHKSVPEMDYEGIYRICHLLMKGEILRLAGPL